MKNRVLLELDDNNGHFDFNLTVNDAISLAYDELDNLEETINSIRKLKPDCDKLDYTLAVSSGALCGLLDIFLVGKPGESPLGNITDKWFGNRVKDFARICGWKDVGNKNSSSAISFLEKKFKIPYDQRGAGDAGQFIYDLTPTNHHFKSLAHNPTLLGLFFSILDQFTNQSHFVSGGNLISLQQADEKFELRGNNIPSKLFSAVVNWIGHLMSDISGSSGSKSRGMGIPSPILCWSNDIVAIKSSLNIRPTDFDKSVNELAVKMFNKGYDIRFQTTQTIPVVLNELIVRFFYTIRRAVKFFLDNEEGSYSVKELWEACEPFSNVNVKRMLTVAHGSFCLLDVGDAVLKGLVSTPGTFNVVEFAMRVNLVGIGRFTISLYGEVKRGITTIKNERVISNMNYEKTVVNDYIEGLELIYNEYNDDHLTTMIEDFSNSEIYRNIFDTSIELAEKRHVSNEKILYSKEDGDNYFRGSMV